LILTNGFLNEQARL